MTRGARRAAIGVLVATGVLASCAGRPTARPAPMSSSSTLRPATSATPAPATSMPAPPPRATAADSGFVAFGDFGGGPGQAAVAAAMETWARTHRVDALATTGDNVYERGEPSRFGAHLDAPYSALRRTRPLWVSLGNHDVVGGNGPRQLAHLGLPALPYTRDLPGVQLLFLDANDPSNAQADWLDRTLDAAGPPLRIVLFHQPAWSCGPHGSTAAVDAAWVAILERHRVALVLNGHDHNYQRFRSSADVTYVVTGGGGRQLYPISFRCPASPVLIKSAVRYHFVSVEVRGPDLDVTVIAGDGEILDRFSVTRG